MNDHTPHVPTAADLDRLDDTAMAAVRMAMATAKTSELVGYVMHLDERGVQPAEHVAMLAAIQEVVRREDNLLAEGKDGTEEAVYYGEKFREWWPSYAKAYWDCQTCGWVHHPLDPHQ